MIKYKRIALFVGHSKLSNGTYTSAQGIKNEYLINKELANEVKVWLDSIGQPCDVIIIPEGKYSSKSYEDDYKLPIANSGKYDLVVEFHCNSFNKSAEGTEVLYRSSNGKIVAQRVQNKLKTVFKDRGIKFRDDLYMLTKTNPISIMLEIMFIDQKNDCVKYDSIGKKEIARKIAEGLVDSTIKVPSSEVAGETTFFRVVVGSYSSKDNATKIMEEAKQKGFKDAFLDAYKK